MQKYIFKCTPQTKRRLANQATASIFASINVKVLQKHKRNVKQLWLEEYNCSSWNQIA